MAAGDPYWNNVVLALHMDGTNGSTTFTDLKGHAMTAIGNAQISTAQSKFGGASALFDGTGDYLTTPASTDFAFGTGEFTVEAWVNFSNVAVARMIVDGRNTTQIAGFALYMSAASKLVFCNTAADRIIGATSFTVSTWQHVAVCRASGVTRLFLDGVKQGSDYADATNYTDTLATIGADRSGGSLFMQGYIDDLRITKGVARYTANFTPPAAAFPNAPAQISGTVKDSTGTLAPRAVRAYRKSDGALAGATVSHSTTGVFSIPALDASAHFALTHDSDADPYWPNVVLATHFDTDSVIDPYASSVVLGLHMEGTNAGTTFTDVTGKTMTANGNVVTSTATARFGNTSAKFDGTTDWISTPDAASLRMGGGEFTIEGWFHFGAMPASGQNVNLVRKGNSGSSNLEYVFYLLNTAGVYTFCLATSTSGTSATTTSASSAWVPSLNNWVHLAVVRHGSTIRFFVNGVAFGTGTDATTWFGGAGVQTIGASTDGANCLTGFIDDLRITKGVARYTSAFTLPNAPFGSFKDLTGKDLMVIGVPSISTGTKKYGDASLSLSGTLTHLEVPVSTDFTFGSADFTVELYAYLASTATAGLIAMGTGNNQLLLYSNTSNILLYASSTGSSWDVASAAVIKTSFTTAQWYHIVICRKGGVLMAFLDGVGVLNIAVGTTSLTPPLGAIFIGSQNATGNVLNGYIDDLRITKGVARYLSDFTPPERAFPGAVGAGTANAQIFDDLIPI